MTQRIAAVLICLAPLALAADPEFTNDGQLVRPKNYREWAHLTAGLGMTYAEPGNQRSNADPDFGNVFVETSAYRKFVETGKWPEKAIFVIENRQSSTKGSINKGGRFQSDGVLRLEGDGWGSFLFDAALRVYVRLPSRDQRNRLT